jgi:hypothetical protein
MRFQREEFSKFVEDAVPLFKEHHAEVGDYFPDDIPLDVNVEAFLSLDEKGMLRVFTVRDEGELVGYCVHHVSYHLHYKNSLQAAQDAIYISPSHRHWGKRFIDWVDDKLRLEGVDAVYHYVSVNKDYSYTLKKLNYKKIESTYLRRL